MGYLHVLAKVYSHLRHVLMVAGIVECDAEYKANRHRKYSFYLHGFPPMRGVAGEARAGEVCRAFQ